MTKLTKIRQAYRKNLPEFLAIVSRKFPKFVTGRNRNAKSGYVPVFVFHTVEPLYFLSQLQYLKENNYRTIGCDELDYLIRHRKRTTNEVVLTFDDATWTFWTYAFPLLAKFDMKAVLFAIPGIVPDGSEYNANLWDYWKGKCSSNQLVQRGEENPLCTWRELVEMHQSGYVDIQSHSLTHSRISISNNVIDFLNPNFDTDFYGNVNVPLTPMDDPLKPERPLRFGTPIFENESRMTCREMYRLNPTLIRNISSYVNERCGKKFFDRSDWRIELSQKFVELEETCRGRYESQSEAEDAVRIEFLESKNLLEQRLLSKVVRHFCYPWYQGSVQSDEIAGECGYSTVFYGSSAAPNSENIGNDTVCRITRVSDDYLFRLPGKARKSLLAIWTRRLRRFAGKGTSRDGMPPA